MLGFIIFGWPTKTKTIGAASPGYCDHCHNQSVWHLVKTRQWLTLFWIPVFPISTSDYYLYCEICQAGAKLHDDEVEEAKDMVEHTEAYHNRELGEEEYVEHVNQFSETLDPNATEQPALEADAESEDIRGIQ